MNPVSNENVLSEPLISDQDKKTFEFFDFCENPSSDYQSFENIPKDKSNNFKSFSEAKNTLNSEKSVKNSFTKIGIRKSSNNSNEKSPEKRRIPAPFRRNHDFSINSISQKFVGSHPDLFTKSLLEKCENNFEDPTTKRSQRKSSIIDEFPNNMNVIWVDTPRLDLTNRFINLVSQSCFFQYMYFLITITNIVFRVFLMYYFYDTRRRGFEMGSLYLCFFYIPRILYMLSMFKILFHVDGEEVYIERISCAFNSFDENPAKSWNKQLSYDYEINMNDFFGKKQNLIKKWKKKPMIENFKATIKAFMKRILIVIIPVETTLIFFRFFYHKKHINKGCYLKLFLVANWIYQCYECLLIIPCIFCLYYLEYKFNRFWTPDQSYDSISFTIQIWEAFQFLGLTLILTVFNCEKVEIGPFHFHTFVCSEVCHLDLN